MLSLRLVVLLTVTAALVCGSASADLNFGAYSRSIAMGGAGLALTDDPITTGAINPAAYAARSPGLQMVLPSIDFRMQGASLSELLDVRRNVQDASGDSAIDLARVLGKQDTKVELGAYTGVAAGPVVVTLDGQAAVALAPSLGFQTWARDADAVDWSTYVDPVTGDVDVAALRDDYYADVTGRAMAAVPAVAVGMKVPGRDDWNVGVRIKSLRSTAVFERVQPGTPTVSGSFEDPTLSLDLVTIPQPGRVRKVDDSGIGADVGIIYEVPNPRYQVATALVMTNFIKPDLEGMGLERMVSAGAAVRLSNKLLVAADVVNITGAYDQGMRLRLGAEVTPVRWIALRAGYGGGNLTAGLGLRGLNIAFSKNTPLVVGRAWNF